MLLKKQGLRKKKDPKLNQKKSNATLLKLEQ
ncbi:UNVERIFIED_ORG: hypothetical protein DFS12_10635 [Chitinophaga ginsengisegetis]|nr:hypothetical protein [Chitinophaga ginsengisegetis]MDR6649539.1 hypothetical protein [Chitinophaga ginsengisegetis]MDR6655889.1 hypothetical protein [Chitinophaga ginsengisegetis]